MTATTSPKDIRLRAVDEALRAKRPKLLTFDIFDTLVFRRVDRPFDAFALVGSLLRERGRLRPSMTPAMFGAVRGAAETRSRERRAAIDDSRETDLHGIYDCFPSWPFADDVGVEELVSTEVEVERGLLIPDLDVVAFLEQIKAGGQRVAAVSDIYFREATLRELLSLPRVGPLVADIEIFTSCDLGFGKGTGLWERTREVLGAAPSEIVHFGDNPLDDVERARAEGVTACWFPQRDEGLAAIKASERRLRESVARPRALEYRNSLQPAGLQAMRGKIVEASERPGDAEPYWRYGATILGPVLSGFAQWIAREAAHAGVTRLACLMREGTLLSELVRDAGALEGVQLEPVPTWLNRHVGLSATVGRSDDAIERLRDGRSALTVDEAVRLLGLDLADVPALHGQANTRLFDPTVRRALAENIERDPALLQKIAAHARVTSGRVAQVLERSADPTGALWLVDLGWGASIQRDAVEILRAAGSELTVTGFYLMTNQSALRRVANGLDVRSFLLDAGSNEELVDLVMRSPEVIEQVTCDAVGTQIGLDDALEPINAQLDPATDGQREQAEAVRRGVRDFHRTWAKYRSLVPGLVPSLADAQFELTPILVRSIVAPTSEEAWMFGDWRHDEGRGSAREDQLASVDHAEMVLHAAPDTLQQVPMQQLYWPAGLVARYSPGEAPLAQAAASGLVPWGALSRVVGTAKLSVVDSTAHETAPPSLKELRANAGGNVLLRWEADGADLVKLDIELCLEPHVVRLDALELLLWEQGAEVPRQVRLAAADLPLQVALAHYVTVAHNVFAARVPGAGISIDLQALRKQVIYRVEVRGAYGLLPAPGTLGADVPFESERVEALERTVERLEGTVRVVTSSSSWRMTSPLRRAAGVARRLS